MKSLMICFLSLILIGYSCQKETVSSTQKSSVMSLLTAKQWIFDSMYTNYTGTGTGILSFSRAGNIITVNVSNYRYAYWPQMYVDMFTPTGYLQQPWAFTSADSNVLYYVPTSFRSFPVYQRIIKLDNSHLTVYDSTSSQLDIFIIKP